MDEPNEYPPMRWLVFMAGGMTLIAGSMFNISFAAILPEISRSLDIDIVVANSFMWAFMLAVSFSVIAGGFLCDRFGILFVLALSACLASVGALLMPWVGHSFSTALAARILEGVGTGFAFCLISPIMTIWFPEKERGLVAGLIGCAVAFGAVIGFPLSSTLFEATGSWQQMSAWISLAGWVPFLITLGLVAMPKPPLPSQTPDIETVQDKNAFRLELSEPLFYICLMISFFAAWQLQTILSNTPAYLAADVPVGLGFGHMTASKLMLFFSIAMMLAPVASGIIQDKVFQTNARPFIFIGFALCCIFMYLISLPMIYTSRSLLIVCLIFSGSGIAVLAAAIPLFIGLNYPVHILGKAYGIIAGLGNFGGAAGLFVSTLAVEARGNYHLAIVLISLMALNGFILAFFLKRWKTTPEKMGESLGEKKR